QNRPPPAPAGRARGAGRRLPQPRPRGGGPRPPADSATSYAPTPPPAGPAAPSTVFGEPTDRPATAADIPSPDPNTPYVAFQAGRFLTAFATATRRVEEKGDPKAMTLLGELDAEAYACR